MILKLNTRTVMPVNLAKAVTASFSDKLVVAKYSQTPETKTNWGDAVNPVIISHFSGKRVININDLAWYNGNVFSVIGSILDNNKVENLCVYGSGFKDFKSRMHVGPKKVFAVRGPLTQKKLKDLGYDCPSVFGDPAILYKQIFNPTGISKRYKLGIIPHYTEKHSQLLTKLRGSSEVLVIDIQHGLHDVVKDVASCEYIVSSSLHGLILADTYEVPSAWIKIEGNLMGDDFKFLDYYASIGEKSPSPLQLSVDTTQQQLVGITKARTTSGLIKGLLDSIPFNYIGIDE